MRLASRPASPAPRRTLSPAAAIALAGLGYGNVTAVRAATPDPIALGRQKFVQCATCHGADGRSTVVPQYPKIGGQSAAYVVIALKAYRDGRRLGTFAAMMTEVAKPLSDADIEDLAAYIESLDGK